eukprot:352696-Chlamydomonas_euryale.AAC.2
MSLMVYHCALAAAGHHPSSLGKCPSLRLHYTPRGAYLRCPPRLFANFCSEKSPAMALPALEAILTGLQTPSQQKKSVAAAAALLRKQGAAAAHQHQVAVAAIAWPHQQGAAAQPRFLEADFGICCPAHRLGCCCQHIKQAA